jgi:hypothetical protein
MNNRNQAANGDASGQKSKYLILTQFTCHRPFYFSNSACLTTSWQRAGWGDLSIPHSRYCIFGCRETKQPTHVGDARKENQKTNPDSDPAHALMQGGHLAV